MPTIRQSSHIDPRRVQASSDVREAIHQPWQAPAMSIPPQATSQVSPFMVASLPSIASGADVYVRQFYRGGPRQRRFMPIAL